MDYCTLFLLSCTLAATTAWSVPFYPVSRAPLRVTRFAPHPHSHPHPHPHPHLHPHPPHHRIMPRPDHDEADVTESHRPKRDHDDDYGRDYDHNYKSHADDHRDKGVTGPVHTFVKTDKNANYKWGVRHHVGNKYAQ